MLKLKVSHRDVPKLVPFSVVYLYLEDECAAMRAAFPALFELRPYQLRLDLWAQVCVHTQQPVTVDEGRALSKTDATSTLRDALPELFEAGSPWFVGVPTVLTSAWTRKGAPTDRTDVLNIDDPRGASIDASPAYMGHRHSGNWVYRRGKAPQPDPHIFLSPVLAVQGAPDKEVCTTCPRYAHNAAGLCFFGDLVCSDHITGLGAPTFLQHLAAYLAHTGETDDLLSGEPGLSGTPQSDA